MQKVLTAETATPTSAASAAAAGSLPIVFMLAASHGMNDTMQSLIPAIYPLLKAGLALSFTQIGLIQAAFQVTASLLQPLVGLYTDKRPLPYSLPLGMAFTLVGLVLLSQAASYPTVLIAAMIVGIGSSVFHPEASRVARQASGGRVGFAQSVFQTGGNAGSALGPILAGLIVVPYGQGSVAWFGLIAIAAIITLSIVARWYSANLRMPVIKRVHSAAAPPSRRTVTRTMTILIVLMFSKFVYLASISSYLQFYLIDRFGVTHEQALTYLTIYLVAAAAGTFAGGPIGDRIGPKYVIWVSILGVLPLTLLLPWVGLTWTAILLVPIGFILASAFPAIVVYAQELMPGHVGLVSGLFFGLAFGLGGGGAALLGGLADWTNIATVYLVCSVLPAAGLLSRFPAAAAPKRMTAMPADRIIIRALFYILQ